MHKVAKRRSSCYHLKDGFSLNCFGRSSEIFNTIVLSHLFPFFFATSQRRQIQLSTLKLIIFCVYPPNKYLKAVSEKYWLPDPLVGHAVSVKTIYVVSNITIITKKIIIIIMSFYYYYHMLFLSKATSHVCAHQTCTPRSNSSHLCPS